MKKRSGMKSNNWETPKDFYDKLNEEFKFDFDPCPYMHDMSWDGLKIDWGKSNFVNPPYSKSIKEKFIYKAIEEKNKGNLIVMLLPVSTSTKIFHDYILPNCSDIRFVKGRIKFKGYNTNSELKTKSTGMHDSMIVIFK